MLISSENSSSKADATTSGGFGQKSKTSKLTNSQKNWLVFSLIVSNVIGGTLYLNMSSFYPIFVQDHYSDTINSTMVSVAISAFEFAAIVCNPIHAMTISKIGRKNAIILGEVIGLVASAGLGFLAYVDDSNWQLFFGASIAIRFVEGYGGSMSETTSFSLITSTFTEEKEEYIGYMEASAGVGLIIGPVIAGFTYGKLGFANTFFAFSLLILINILNVIFLVPSSLNSDGNHEKAKDRVALLGEYSSAVPQAEGKLDLLAGKNLLALNEVGYFRFLAIKPLSLALFANFMSTYTITFFESFLALQIESYGVEEDKVGYFFPVFSGPYLVAAILASLFLTKVPRKLSFVLCFASATVGMLLMGPASWLGLPHSLAISCIGMAIVGLTCSLVFIPCLPEMIDSVYLRYQITEGVNPALDNKIADTTSSMYMMVFSFSTLVSPIIGGVIYDHWGFEATTNVSAGLMALSMLILIVFNCGSKFAKQFAKERETLKELRSVKKQLEASEESEQKGCSF